MSRSAPRYGDETTPLAIAHRGGAAMAPENTLDAFALSVALGVRYLETDVKVTADGELMCFHDETLERATTGSGAFGARTRSELDRMLVTGPDGTFARIPSLSEALDAFPDARFTVDLKDRAAIAPMARLLRREDYGRRVCVAGAWDGWLETLRSQAPHVQTALGWRSLTTLISMSRTGVPVPPEPRARPLRPRAAPPRPRARPFRAACPSGAPARRAGRRVDRRRPGPDAPAARHGCRRDHH